MWNPEPYSRTYTRSKTTMAHASARRKVLEREDKAKEVETLEVEEASSGNKDDENSDNGGSSSDESSENEEVEVEEDSSRGNKIDENSDNGGSSSSSSSEESHEIDEASRRGKSRGSRGGRGGRRNIVSEDDSGSKNDENGENEEIQEVEYTSRGRGGRRGRGRGRGRGRSRDIERCGVDEMHGPFPGGPTNTSVLQNYSNHVARDVWDGIERGVLKVHMHITKFREWNINKENIKFRNALEKTCFWNLIEHHRRYTNIPLVSSFVERWYSDTNTFHFNFGEMTITLDDVSQILGLPIIGKAAVASSKIGKGEASVLLENCLGISTTSINEELSNPKRTENHVSHDWLKKNLMYKIKDTSTDEEVRCVVRGYLLYLFGCLLFVDKTGVQVSVAYLEMLKDYEKVNDYAWGAAILAHLYRMLSDASRANVAQMAGFVTLLEVWIYEHFPMFCPPPNMSYLEETPRVRRWSDYSSAYPDQMGTLRWFRECIDKLAPIHVYWDPYSIVRQVRPLHEISFFHGELGVLDITEAYHADRVLRPFSHVQLIPSESLPKTKHRRTEGHYEVASRLFNMWPSHLLSSELRGSRVLSPWDCEKGYLTWFYTISHPVMTKPGRFSKLHMPLPYDCKCQEKEIFANDES